jgi:hypothetical protein
MQNVEKTKLKPRTIADYLLRKENNKCILSMICAICTGKLSIKKKNKKWKESTLSTICVICTGKLFIGRKNDMLEYLKSMDDGTWCLLIDSNQDTWVFEVTPQGLTLLDTTMCNRLTPIPEGFDDHMETTGVLGAWRECKNLESYPSISDEEAEALIESWKTVWQW